MPSHSVLPFSYFLNSSTNAQLLITNPAISPETVEELHEKITALETQLQGAQAFVSARQPELLELKDKIDNADEDMQIIIGDLRSLVDKFKTGSEIQVAVQSSMQDVKRYIDEFRAGSEAQQTAAESLKVSLASMEETDDKRDDLVERALREIRRLEAMKSDLVALRIAGAFKEMADLYDTMVSEFEATVNQTIDVSDSIEGITQLPVQ